MDIIFLLIAICPSIVMAKHDLAKEDISWKTYLPRFAEWFYGITFINLFILYYQDWGDFDFSVLSVQFLWNYMLNSTAVVVLVYCYRWLRQKIKRNRSEFGEQDYDL